ncbi:hypothetical protein [Kistimonas asteriae]|uniref:hypothetical protein n=1 Tax=Kistimonas asteriae TaxID=517724 RepID=UPI001BA7602F|nr:hypothetical protein [Kistimonas asteriae]
MNDASRYTGFYFDGTCFDIAVINAVLSWPCQCQSDEAVAIPEVRVIRQKAGTLTCHCPACHCQYLIEITSASQPLQAEIIQTDTYH